MSDMSCEELLETFSLLTDWEECYQIVIDLGQELPPMDEALKNEKTRVLGCTSRVWLSPDRSDPSVFCFYGDSDAHIVRGLIAILRIAYCGRSPSEAALFDIEDFFTKLELQDHLSPNRRNGFFSMVERIKALALSW